MGQPSRAALASPAEQHRAHAETPGRRALGVHHLLLGGGPLCQHGRFRFAIPVDTWLDEATAVPGIQVVPLSLPIVITAARLTALRDPADMLIVATAQHHGARLVTSDARISETDLVAVVS